MSVAADLWSENQDLAERARTHPFVRGIADGTLPRGTFSSYIAQDTFFLESFARGYALAVAHSPDRQALDAFATLLAGVLDERHRGVHEHRFVAGEVPVGRGS